MKSTDKPGELGTILGKGAVVDGNIKVEHSLRVDGKVVGDVTSGDTLIVGAEGEIKGNVKVKNLVLGGRINGSVLSPGRTVLEARSELRGELKTGKLVIDEGAIFDGKCSMSDAKAETGRTPGEADGETIIK
ncbi:MAG: Polymer-forming cytoskeletal [bacterium ADurb.Bin431]|nr:MAG: Polymer-forming cytoskeletal [bacterium ADurb.Bin431]HNY91282.1 polymer-forming cytoskeletal protein [bacterium]HOC24332.1 polymer-forming cytoskeletal protein [bacterium]HOH06707.1 polymer-forming cytoskeletal protein [bacterium]HOY43140.1 polymer-forming cytoskeletal protein [bacterium]